MKRYIGTKKLSAKPFTRGEYNHYRGWPMPLNEDPNDKGYLVEYEDGGKANHPNHKGYISWSPADVFERSYKEIDDSDGEIVEPKTGMNFSLALAWIKQGARVQRIGWNGKNMFIFLVKGSTFKVNRAPLNEFYPEGTEINYHAHIDMRTADGTIVPWLCSQTDMLANDWQVVADVVTTFDPEQGPIGDNPPPIKAQNAGA